MAAKKTVKKELAAAVLENAKEAMRKLGVKKVYVSEDGYVFALEADVRAYVGKDGSYGTVTDSDKVEAVKEAPKPETGTGDNKLDEHTHIDETDGN